MVSYLRSLEEILPEHLRQILEWEFIPWSFIKTRHTDLTSSSLTSLLGAYQLLQDHLDLESIAMQKIPEDSWGCMRCGFCCSSMRPGPVKATTYMDWENAGAPAALFYEARRKGKNRVYKCWYYGGVRLNICPFMLINLNDSKPFCSIYHMGDEYRPSVCAKYVPRHETCTLNPPKIEPWENN